MLILCTYKSLSLISISIFICYKIKKNIIIYFHVILCLFACFCILILISTVYPLIPGAKFSPIPPITALKRKNKLGKNVIFFKGTINNNRNSTGWSAQNQTKTKNVSSDLIFFFFFLNAVQFIIPYRLFIRSQKNGS